MESTGLAFLNPCTSLTVFLKWSEANAFVVVVACLLFLTWITWLKARNTLYLCNSLYVRSCMHLATSVAIRAFHMPFLAFWPLMNCEQEPQTALLFCWIQLQLSQAVVRSYEVERFIGSWTQKLKLASKFLGEIRCKTIFEIIVQNTFLQCYT